VTPRIADHDIVVKVNNIKRLLNRSMVRVNVVFRGREVTHPEFGINVLKKIVEETKDIANVEAASLVPNKNNMYFVLLRKGEKVKIVDEVIKKIIEVKKLDGETR
jgi:translation initiation factor IF-3